MFRDSDSERLATTGISRDSEAGRGTGKPHSERKLHAFLSLKAAAVEILRVD